MFCRVKINELDADLYGRKELLNELTKRRLDICGNTSKLTLGTSIDIIYLAKKPDIGH